MERLSDLYQRLGRNDPSLTMVNLNYCGIGDVGATELAFSLRKNSQVVVLFLDGNEIGSKGAKELAYGIANHPTLEFLYLAHNNLGDVGAAALGAALRTNRRLQVLKLSYCEIGTRGAKALSEGLKANNTLQRLDLEENQLANMGCRCFAEALLRNTGLRVLDLRCNDMSPSIQDYFTTALTAENRALRCLMFWDDECPSRSDGLDKDPELALYLHLNRLGRRDFGSSSVCASAWTRVLARAGKEDPSALWLTLRARPDLLTTAFDEGKCSTSSEESRTLKKPRTGSL